MIGLNTAVWHFSFVLIVIGLAGIAAGLILREYYRQKKELKGHVTARVVDLVLQERPEGMGRRFTNQYHPVLEYYAGGKLYKQIYPYGTWPSAWEINQQVSIDYNTDNPEEYEVSRSSARTKIAQLLYYAGIGVLTAGVLLFLSFARRG